MFRVAGLWSKWKVWWISVASGVALGCLLRAAAFSGTPWLRHRYGNETTLVVTIAFLAVVPFAMGYLSVRQYLSKTTAEDLRWWHWLFLPWVAVLLEILGFAVIGWEGTICLIFASPIMLVLSLLGGLAARLVWHNWRQRSPGTVSAIAFPLLLIVSRAVSPLPTKSAPSTPKS